MAHRSGFGPIAVTEKIEQQFGESPVIKQEKLDFLFLNTTGNAPCTQGVRGERTRHEFTKIVWSVCLGETTQEVGLDIKQIKEGCQELMQKYALPSEEVKTQIDTFKSIILLSTRYPVLRKFFIGCTHSERISSASFKEAWTRPMDERTPEWEFAFSLVISCLSENTLANLLEGTKPSLLGGTTELDSGHVDLLIPQLYSPDYNPLKLLATRYLSGILEMPIFWDDPRYKVQCVAVKRLCMRVVELIEDTGLTSDNLENEPGQLASMDLDGIDLLADSILAGVETWRKKKEADELRAGCWVETFSTLIILLGSDKRDITDAFPISSRRATNTNWRLFDIHDGVSDTLKYEVREVPRKFWEGMGRKQDREPEGKDKVSRRHIEESDVVILVMGPTGVGKSSIINRIAGKDVVEVADGMESCTSSAQHVIIPHPTDEKRHIILVDTPGLDNTHFDDVEVLRRIAFWLERFYIDGMKLAGFIYLHNISERRMFGTTRGGLGLFRKLCGDEVLRNVVLGTTRWDDVSLEKGQQREQQLKDIYWGEMLQRGSVAMRVHTDSSSAWEIVNRILENDAVDFVRFQERLQKTISDMEAEKLEGELEWLRKQLLAEANMGDGLKENPKRMRKRNILQSKQAKI